MKVWVNGCFDILHYGHFKLLEHAHSLGDYVVVGIDSDRRVEKLKGVGRPYHTQHQRRSNLLSLKWVHKVVVFDSEDELVWNIQNEEVDILVIGSDYKDKKIIGGDWVRSINFFNRLDKFSTTGIINGKYNS
jgi:D-beta-D-heptose 7-phosphate kinase/D-beta-D-heptose 1-phosphate adenosyltransferase